MLNKKLLITALSLALCTAAFTSCGRNVATNGDGSDTASATESASRETETRDKETTAIGSATDTVGTTDLPNTDGLDNTETTEMGNGSDSTVMPDGGDIVGRIGDDARDGMDNVKRGVEDFFKEDVMPPAPRGHRGRVPFGK